METTAGRVQSRERCRRRRTPSINRSLTRRDRPSARATARTASWLRPPAPALSVSYAYAYCMSIRMSTRAARPIRVISTRVENVVGVLTGPRITARLWTRLLRRGTVRLQIASRSRRAQSRPAGPDACEGGNSSVEDGEEGCKHGDGASSFRRGARKVDDHGRRRMSGWRGTVGGWRPAGAGPAVRGIVSRRGRADAG